ncbi:MAG: hypothetical protein IPO21_14755 [Bacteroidales bacterium]|nr:hypothetical protein [Bacteroidales bacterium]
MGLNNIMIKNKTMKKIKLFGLTSIFFSLIACGQTTQKNVQSDIPDDWKTIDESFFTIQYPDSFELNKSGQMGMSFILLSKQTSQQDLFRENVNLIIQDLTGQNINLDKYVEISEGQIRTMITNGNIIESKRIKTDDLEYQKVIYTGTQGQFKLKFEQYYLIVKQKAYILTLTCETNQFDKYQAIGEKIMNSFKIK